MHRNNLRTPWHKFAKGLTPCLDDCSLDSHSCFIFGTNAEDVILFLLALFNNSNMGYVAV